MDEEIGRAAKRLRQLLDEVKAIRQRFPGIRADGSDSSEREARADEVVSAYRAGSSTKEIAKRLHMSNSTVHKIVTAAGVARNRSEGGAMRWARGKRPRGFGRGRLEMYMTDAVEDEA